jgi:DNA-binding MarR family transcriptional regulator
VADVAEFRLLVVAVQRLTQRGMAAALKNHDLTPSQAEAVEVIAESPTPLTVREVGDRLIIEQGSPSRLIATCRAKGLVRVLADPHDRRMARLELTQRGWSAAHTVADLKRQLDTAIAARTTPSELDVACRVLRSLVATDSPAGRAVALRRSARKHVETQND